MSLHIAAQHLASKGRGPDQLLVHMAPSEVAGLQALAKAHGGTLTINPETGLPEAGFLSSILPTLIGVGLSVASGGTLTPMMAGLMTGAGYGLATGNLGKGLQAGLGAFGGAGLGAGLMGAGEAALGAEAASGMMGANQAAAMAPQTAGQLGAGFEANMAAQGVAPVAQAAAAAPAGVTGIPGFQGSTVGLTPPPSAPQFAADAVQQAAPQTVTEAAPIYTPAQIETAVTDRMANASWSDKLKAGLGAYGDNPQALMSMENAKYGLAALSPALLQERKQAQYQGSGPNPYNYGFEWERPSGPSYDSREAAQLRGKWRTYAEGGETSDPAKGMTGASADAMRYLMGQSSASPATAAAQQYAQAPVQQPAQQAVQQPVTAAKPAADEGPLSQFLQNYLNPTSPETAPAPIAFAWNPVTKQMVRTATPAAATPAEAAPYYTGDYSGAAGGGLMAAGGISHLGDYSDGGRLLKGPGDGVSDSIPATIGDKRPARLADGEFVVPARIVSELGNGSTEAGARKLYAMMDRIQKARAKTTGKERVAVNSRADKALPA